MVKDNGGPSVSITDMQAIISEIAKTTQCTCDLDRWEPERSTGHSWVCNIHKLAISTAERKKRFGGDNG